MLPDADQLYNIYKVWKDAVDDIADVEGLYPTFVLNTIPRSAATVGKTNGIGNVWGLDDTDSLLSMFSIWPRQHVDVNLILDTFRKSCNY